VRALAARGVNLIVIADATGMPDDSVDEGGANDPAVRYLAPMAWPRLLVDVVTTAVRRPLRFLQVLAYLARRQYQPDKRLADDVRVFVKSVHLAAVLRRLQVDHVHAPWGDTTATVAMSAARLAGAQFSVQFRAHDLHRHDAAFLVADKIRQARFVVTNSDFNVRALGQLVEPHQAGKIRLIRNGLELDRLPAARLRARLEGDIRILCVARLIEAKGLPYLFAACRLLQDRGHRIRCQVIGGPELPRSAADVDEIESARTRLGLEDVVELAGPRPFAAVAAAYAEADIFVLPSIVASDGSQDISPNSLLEAMAAGLPVVSTTITAIPELVEHGVTGLLVPPRDAEALAGALERLIGDAALRADLGAAARRLAVERFDIERNIDGYVELFAK
jgi:colanic acid/amylovoran biosynthesis glycosyltransferase